MFGLDPRLFAVLCVVFVALGIFNIIVGNRRIRQAREQGLKIAWYKQINLLTGIEYILLTLVFLLNFGITSTWFPASLNQFVAPFYLVILLASAALAGIVIYQGMNARRANAAAARSTSAASSEKVATSSKLDSMTAQERSDYIKKRRTRRHKAAVERRRRAGKA